MLKVGDSVRVRMEHKDLLTIYLNVTATHRVSSVYGEGEYATISLVNNNYRFYARMFSLAAPAIPDDPEFF